MRRLVILKLSVVVGMCASLISCGSDSEQILLNLASEFREEKCNVDSLFKLSENEWNRTMDLIRESDGLDVPDEELQLLLDTRNGELLKMFRSYDHFPVELQVKLQQMEDRDHEIAQMIILSQRAKLTIQDSIYTVLSSFSNWNEREKLAQKTNKIMNALCH